MDYCINGLGERSKLIRCGIALAKHKTSFENGRAELIRATGAVLIASVLLYFLTQ